MYEVDETKGICLIVGSSWHSVVSVNQKFHPKFHLVYSSYSAEVLLPLFVEMEFIAAVWHCRHKYFCLASKPNYVHVHDEGQHRVCWSPDRL